MKQRVVKDNINGTISIKKKVYTVKRKGIYKRLDC